MSSAFVDMLVDMGFSESRAQQALKVTGNKGVEPAMEWLLAHSEEVESTPEPPVAESAPEGMAETPNEDSVASTSAENESDNAKSIKCDQCGKLFRTNLEVEFHATKSGHDQFSESTEEKKPLTEEEKKEKLRELEEKLKQKRKEREEMEKKEAVERERHRIRSGKEMAEARKKLEELEMKKILELRKREKEEEKAARQRVKAQIEADKAARRAKLSNDSPPSVPSPTPPPAPTSTTVTSPTARKNYNETRLQIRLTNGAVLTQNFGSKEQLSAVRLYVEMNRTDGSGPFNFVTNFPKRVFTGEDYDMPLEVLGLVPSAVLMVQKR